MNPAKPRSSPETALAAGVLFGVYELLWRALSPAVPLVLRIRAARGKEDWGRIGERYGTFTLGRPGGSLIWVHGASVGECLSTLPLVGRLLEKRPDRHVLVTSGTFTAAQLMKERLPSRAFHQYAPLDSRRAVRRFLNHWRPNLALVVESELWPNRILETKAAGIPMALINARLSERSFRGWSRWPGNARLILGCFDLCLAQDALVAERLRRLGAGGVSVSGSLKAEAPPLPVDQSALAAFRELAGVRPLFLAAQTHPGEDEIVLHVAAALRKHPPGALTVIVPRHPGRGESIAALARRAGFRTARRSSGEPLLPETEVYVADTLGELGLFYRAAKFAFLGGSLVPQGGHNPIEAAILGTAVLTGPHHQNFEEIYGVLLAAEERRAVISAGELAEEVISLLADPDGTARMGARAKKAAESLTGALERTAAAAEQLLTRNARS